MPPRPSSRTWATTFGRSICPARDVAPSRPSPALSVSRRPLRLATNKLSATQVRGFAAGGGNYPRTSSLSSSSRFTNQITPAIPTAPPPTSSTKKPPPPPPPERDEKITLPSAQLVDLSNKLLPLCPLSSILDTYSKSTHTLTVVSRDPPIVKLVDKREVNEKGRQAKEKAKQKKAKRMEDVDVAISWESAPGDVEHKLSKARTALESGDRVRLTFSHKSGGSTETHLTGPKLLQVQSTLPDQFLTTLSTLSQEFKPPLTRTNPISKELTKILHLQPSKEIRSAVISTVERALGAKEGEKEKAKEDKRKREEKRVERARQRERELEAIRKSDAEIEVFRTGGTIRVK